MPGPPPLGAEQDVLGLIHNLDEKRLAVYKKKAELDVKERLRAAEAFKARVKEEAEREQLDFVARCVRAIRRRARSARTEARAHPQTLHLLSKQIPPRQGT